MQAFIGIVGLGILHRRPQGPVQATGIRHVTWVVRAARAQAEARHLAILVGDERRHLPVVKELQPAHGKVAFIVVPVAELFKENDIRVTARSAPFSLGSQHQASSIAGGRADALLHLFSRHASEAAASDGNQHVQESLEEAVEGLSVQAGVILLLEERPGQGELGGLPAAAKQQHAGDELPCVHGFLASLGEGVEKGAKPQGHTAALLGRQLLHSDEAAHGVREGRPGDEAVRPRCQQGGGHGLRVALVQAAEQQQLAVVVHVLSREDQRVQAAANHRRDLLRQQRELTQH